MSKVIMVGCDLHDRSLLICFAVDRGEPRQATFSNDAIGREGLIQMLADLQKKHRAKRVVFAYEASGQGYGLCDLLDNQGIECHVLSPTQLPKSPKSAKQKTDAKDALMLLEQVRGFVLGGNRLPVVWTPPQRLRDDRELIRARVDTAEAGTRIKLQILSMLKRYGLEKPRNYRSKWSKAFVAWLRETAAGMDEIVAPVMENLIARYELFLAQEKALDKRIKALSGADRYRAGCEALRKIPGVGLLTAMMFLTEMGDLDRFHNRREVAAYLGLCPASFESGETNDRKGRITRQGPSRLRKLLCQAAWISMIHCEETRAEYYRIRGSKPGRSKKAIVAVMRRLAIRLWHAAKECPAPNELRGRGGPHDRGRVKAPRKPESVPVVIHMGT
jgi:transposase